MNDVEGYRRKMIFIPSAFPDMSFVGAVPQAFWSSQMIGASQATRPSPSVLIVKI
jgi:hypothetical protein